MYLPSDDFAQFLTLPEPIAAWGWVIDGYIVGNVALNRSASAPVTDLIRRAGIERDLGVVARLLVAPGFRNWSIGTQLLEYARSVAVDLGLVPVLDVVTSSVGPIELYRRAGWVELGEVRIDLLNGQTIEEQVFCSA